MRQAHVAGEKLFVDYTGMTMDIFDATTDEVHSSQTVRRGFGKSGHTYAEAAATQSQSRLDRIAYTRFRFLRRPAADGGSDKSEVRHRQSLLLLASRRSSLRRDGGALRPAIVPVRPRKPRNKGKVEVAAQVATRRISAKLRSRRFFSLPELSAAIRKSLVTLSDQVFWARAGAPCSTRQTDRP